MTLKPLASQVVVIDDEVKESEIIATLNRAVVQPLTGKVVAVGEGRKNSKGVRLPLSVSVGDRVVYTQFTGQHVTHEGVKYLILHEEDLIGITDEGVEITHG